MPLLQSSLPALLLFPLSISAVTLDCSQNIRVDKKSFNLASLAGPRTVHNQIWEPPSIANTTFTLDLCAPLQKPSGSKKGEECPMGTRVCGKEWDYREGFEPSLKEVIPIAGEYSTTSGGKLEPKVTRLKDSASHSDAEREGLRIELHGGKYPDDTGNDRQQKAIIELVCDPDWTGREGFDEEEKSVDGVEYSSMRRREAEEADEEDDDSPPELPDLDEGKALQFLKYENEGDYRVLRLSWKTKHACEDVADIEDPDEPKAKGSWGFFTWFIIIVFLLAAAYIIFGSWLNYNRYGARGWDLIPHGDTIRDIPYLVRDWIGGLAGRLRLGNDTRGGYSAV